MSMERAAFRFFKSAGRAGVADALFSLADLLAAYEDKVTPVRWEKGVQTCANMLDAWFNRYEQVVTPLLLLNGDDLMQELKLSPGPLIGELLDDLEEAQAAGEVRLPEEARQFVKSRLGKSKQY